MANTTVNIDIQVQSKSLNELEQELADINAELKEVPVGSQAFKDLSQEAQGLTKELNKAQEAAEGFTSEEKFRAADGAIKLMGGSLASVVGTLGVLGVESEAFGEFEEKAASAIAVAIGFKDVGEGITQLGPLLGKAGSAVKGFSLTTKQALIATGIGAFVVILGTVIAYWDDITDAVESFGEKVPFVGQAIDAIKGAFDALFEAARPVLEFLGILPDEIERANAAAIESNNELITNLEREIAVLQASGAAAEEVYKKKKELIEAELDNLKRNEADKKEIFKKETELQVLEASETTRKKNEELKKQEEATKAANAKKLESDKDYHKESYDDFVKFNDLKGKELDDAIAKEIEYERKVDKQIEDLRNANVVSNIVRARKIFETNKKRITDEKDLALKTLDEQLNKGIISEGAYDTRRQQIKNLAKEKEIANQRELKDATITFNKEIEDSTKESIQATFQERRDKLQQYSDLFSDVLTNIIDLSQQRYDRELLNLERERSAVESNTNLTEEERTASLNRIEAKERELEIRRIKAERDQFQLKQALLLAEEILKTKFFVQEQIRINALTATEASAAATSVAIEGGKQTGKAAMSLGSFVSTLGPLGVAVFAASIGGIIASIVAARKNARAQIDALGVPNVSGGGINPSAVPAAPVGLANTEERAPQSFSTAPVTRTYVLTGDVTSGMEAEAKLNTKRTIG